MGFGLLRSAAWLMGALASARALCTKAIDRKSAVEASKSLHSLQLMARMGTFRFRGKGRGSISPTWGKSGWILRDSGYHGRAMTRRRRQIASGQLRTSNGLVREVLF